MICLILLRLSFSDIKTHNPIFIHVFFVDIKEKTSVVYAILNSIILCDYLGQIYYKFAICKCLTITMFFIGASPSIDVLRTVGISITLNQE